MPKHDASKFLYVPTNGRKIPLPDWKWVANCPEDVDPRSEANDWVLSYEQTQNPEFVAKIKEHFPNWDGDWIRVASVEGYKWYNVDIDLDPDAHDVVLSDPDAIGINADIATVIETSGGVHIDILTTEDVDDMRAPPVEGIDHQGDTFTKGVAGNPFHGSDSYEVKNVGRVIEEEHELITDTAAITYRQKALFEIAPDDEISHEESIERASEHPIDMTHFFPNKGVKERFAHPIHGSSTNSNMFIDDTGLGHCFRHNTTFNAYHFIAMQEGILTCGEWDEHDAGYAGKYDEIKEACDERNIAVPAYWESGEWSAEFEPIDSMGQGDMSVVWDIRRELKAKVFAALDEEVDGHLVGPKGSGKTHNIVSVAQNRQVFAAAPTTDKYEEIAKEASEQGVSTLILPSFPRHSAIYDDWVEHYEAGAYPRELYGWEERDVGEDEYRRRSDIDWDDYDLLIGAPQHLNLQSAVEDRVVMADDVELGTFRTRLTSDDLSSVNRLLEQCSDEYESYQQLEREGTWATLRREVVQTLSEGDRFDGIDTIEEALEIVQDDELDRRQVIEGLGLNLQVLDFARVMCGEVNRGEDYQMYRYEGSVRRIYKNAPRLETADRVWTLGATFNRDELEELFELMGRRFDGVFGSNRHGDMEAALDRWVIQTSDAQHVKSRADGSNANVDRIEAITDGMQRLGDDLGIDETCQVFSTKSEIDRIEASRGSRDNLEHYSMLTGLNEYSNRHVAVVGGAQHFGDNHVRDVAVSTGAAPDSPIRENFNPAVWQDATHRRIDRQMRQSGVYEAITRLGRDDSDTTVVAADTACLPEYLQVIDQSNRVRQLSGAEKAIIRALRSEGILQVKNASGMSLTDVTEYSAVRLYEAVAELRDNGWIEVVGEGDYGAKRYEIIEDDSVSSSVKGLQMAKLTGSVVSHAENPKWDLIELKLGDSVTTDVRQMELTELIPSD